MKLAEYVGLASGVLSIIGALQSFFNADFSLKLLVLVATGIIALWITARRLSNWMKRKAPFGFNVAKTAPPSITKRVVAILVLGLISLIFSWTAVLVLKWDAINVDETIEPDRVEFWIQGSRREASMLTVIVPAHNECAPIPDIGHLADTTMVDWDSSNPYLQIAHFSYRHRQGVSCNSQTTIHHLELRPEPAGLEIFYPDRRFKYVSRIFTFGGILWIASIFFAILRSR